MDKMTQERYNRSRERNDKISALMGQYMLKGYRMLSSVCEACGTVLLKYRDEEEYCVACREVDVDTQSTASTQAGNPQITTDTLSPLHQHNEAAVRTNSSVLQDSQDSINTAVQAVNDKIIWASCALKASHSVGECQQLCQLLKTCAETIRALKAVEH